MRHTVCPGCRRPRLVVPVLGSKGLWFRIRRHAAAEPTFAEKGESAAGYRVQKNPRCLRSGMQVDLDATSEF